MLENYCRVLHKAASFSKAQLAIEHLFFNTSIFHTWWELWHNGQDFDDCKTTIFFLFFNCQMWNTVNVICIKGELQKTLIFYLMNSPLFKLRFFILHIIWDLKDNFSSNGLIIFHYVSFSPSLKEISKYSEKLKLGTQNIFSLENMLMCVTAAVNFNITYRVHRSSINQIWFWIFKWHKNLPLKMTVHDGGQRHENRHLFSSFLVTPLVWNSVVSFLLWNVTKATKRVTMHLQFFYFTQKAKIFYILCWRLGFSKCEKFCFPEMLFLNLAQNC